MSKWNWDTDRNEASNVSVNDGVVTYFAEWDTADDDVTIDLQDVADSFADGYDHNNEPGSVAIVVENLLTGEELEDEMIWEDEAEGDDEDDADDDGEDADDADDEQ